MKSKAPILAGLLSLAAQTGRADPTWPAATDHMEEIIYQLQGFQGSLFNDIITPCNNEAAGPGRITASEWLRVGFQYVYLYYGASFRKDGWKMVRQFSLVCADGAAG
jgi:hypothetical protein